MPDLLPDAVLLVLVLVAAVVPLRLLADPRTVPPGRVDPPARRPVSVVVPARDEEQSLPGLLDGLRASTLAPAEVLVVDDGSRDRTGEVARAAGARVLPATEPPPGWTGKAWACQTGADRTTGELLLFLDADTVLAPDALDGLVQLHDEHGGLVSVQPHHRVGSASEQLSAYFNVVALMSSDAFTGRPSSRPMAFGPCLLTSRADHALVGGHAAVRGEILDDVRLARAYDRAGLPVTCAVGGRSVWMRSYPGGLRQLLDGWTKNIASGAADAAPGASAATVLWICAHHAVAVGALLSLVGAAVGRDLAAGSAALWAACWVLLAAQLRSLLRRAGSFAWWTWLLFPLPLLAFDLVFARSALLTVVRRSVRWRGRPVDVGHARADREVP